MLKQFITYMFGFLTGILINLLTPSIEKFYRRCLKFKHRIMGTFQSFQYDPKDDELYMINTWSDYRRLTQETLKIKISEKRPAQKSVLQMDIV
jgi:hypothetical protein